MDINSILTTVSRMFPNTNIQSVAEKAQQAIQGTPDTLDGVSSVAHRLGISQGSINEIFGKYGNTMQARAICRMMGTTPEALKADAERIVRAGTGKATPNPPNVPQSTRFPRLK